LTAYHPQTGQLLPQAGLESTDLQRSGRGLLQCPGPADHLLEALQLGLFQGEVITAAQQQMGFLASERGEDIEEWNRLAVHGDGEPKVEPIGVTADGDVDTPISTASLTSR